MEGLLGIALMLLFEFIRIHEKCKRQRILIHMEMRRRLTAHIIALVCNRSLAAKQPRSNWCKPRSRKFWKSANAGQFDIVHGFEDRWGFPQTVGAIDGSHIPILKQSESASDYFNRKCFYSIIIQAVVDFRGRSLDINIRWPGKVHDARVFANSLFFRRVNSGDYLPDMKWQINGVDVPLCILGDPAYPLLTWLMKPYPDSEQLTNKHRIYNYQQGRARIVVENAFG
uniref:DDE Tnp4 domain-containing protein n=1 Tax=Amphimedon queenslandica TaxID=400682 RepID=A0A1X7U3J5_AMPQE